MRIIASAIGALLIVAHAGGQSAPAVLSMPGSTRALALGGSYVTSQADADAIFVNPVLLLTGRGISASFDQLSGAERYTGVSAALDLNFGMGVQVLDRAGDLGVAASAGYARTIKRIRLGVGAKYLQESRSTGFAFDLGSSINPISWLTVALAARNLGPDFERGPVSYELPRELALHAATNNRVLGEIDYRLAANVSHDLDSELYGGAGIELGYWPVQILTFNARAGARFGQAREGMTLGGGVTYSRVTLDYAWADDQHRVGIRVR